MVASLDALDGLSFVTFHSMPFKLSFFRHSKPIRVFNRFNLVFQSHLLFLFYLLEVNLGLFSAINQGLYLYNLILFCKQSR